MGKMKEIFIEQQEELHYRGAHDAMIHGLARQACEEFITEGKTPCPNCFEVELVSNETEAKCVNCGQQFIYIENNVLRYK